MELLKRNTAGQSIEFTLVSSGDGETPQTGETVFTETVSGDGSVAAGDNAVSEIGSGVYEYTPSQAETNVTQGTIMIECAGCITREIRFRTTTKFLDDLNDFNPTTEVDIGKIKGVGVTDVDDFKATGFLDSDDIVTALTYYGVSAVDDIPTVDEIADGVWDELAAGHLDAGKAGTQLWTDIDAVLADTAAMQPLLATNLDVVLSTARDAIISQGNSAWTTADLTGIATAANITTSQGVIIAAIPSAAAVSTQVDTDLSSSHGSGSWEGPAAAPTAAAIDTYLTAQHGSGAWTSSAGDSGSSSWTETITDTDTGQPLDGVEVKLSSDALGQVLVAGPLYTDTLGQVTFYIDPGTYYLWKQKGLYNFTNPKTIEVT